MMECTSSPFDNFLIELFTPIFEKKLERESEDGLKDKLPDQQNFLQVRVRRPDPSLGASRFTKVAITTGIIAALALLAAGAAAAIFFGLPIIAPIVAGTILVTYALPIMITAAAIGLCLLATFAFSLKLLMLMHIKRDKMKEIEAEIAKVNAQVAAKKAADEAERKVAIPPMGGVKVI